MFNGEDFVIVKGVILSREERGESFLWSTLFLEGEGIVSLSSKNFMGESEPFVWGYFNLQRKKRSTNYFIYDADIRDDMMKIRRGREPIKAALDWRKLILKHLPARHPDDELLTNLYWSMKLLTFPAVPVDAVSWRFLWLWLMEWGLAPELEGFHMSKGFLREEVLLLSQLSNLYPKEVPQLFLSKINPRVRGNVFKVAAKYAVNFLSQI